MKLNKRTALSFFLIAMFLGSTLISLGDMFWGGKKNMDMIVILVTSMGNIEIALATKLPLTDPALRFSMRASTTSDGAAP